MDSIVFLLLLGVQTENVVALTGHVCSRLRAETYMTTYDRGFICPERYTTACGQLDWRRCTKYRVQTCYTPTERYATRYVTVEECCPGWSDAGTGACSIPVCSGGCDNGGTCINEGGVPGCSCVEGYHGDRCQTEQNSTDIWEVVFISLLCILIIVLCVGVVVLCRKGLPRFSCSVHRQSLRDPDITRPLVRYEDRTDTEFTDSPRRNLFRLGPVTWLSGANDRGQSSAPVMMGS